MKVEIKGFIETTLIDWDGKICSMIFLPYCNFKCPMCHGYKLVLNPEKFETIPLQIVQKNFLKHKDWIDGLVISGGEPTIYPNLPDFIGKIKKLKISIKLDTNGTNFNMLQFLIKENLVDYVAMDIKAPLKEDKYKEISGKIDCFLQEIKKNITLLLEGKIDYEFRTTVVPIFHQREDIEQIAKFITGAKKFVLQQFVPQNALSKKLRNSKTYSFKELQVMTDLCKKYVINTIVRGK